MTHTTSNGIKETTFATIGDAMTVTIEIACEIVCFTPCIAQSKVVGENELTITTADIPQLLLSSDGDDIFGRQREVGGWHDEGIGSTAGIGIHILFC